MSALPARGQHLLLAFLLVLLAACGQAPGPVTLQGPTMGTRYHVTLVAGSETIDPAQMQAGIDAVLDTIEDSMSSWRDDSEISRFNRAPPGKWWPVSAGFLEVFSLARQVTLASDGAYDVSVAPLVELWGFGPGAGASIPGQAQIDAAMQRVGEAYVDMDVPGQRLRKQRPLALDFSSIAKGYGVDKLGQWLEQQGHVNYMVEIGGEIRVRGHSPRGTPWRIAIEKPEPVAREAVAVLEITDQAVATSGDYRNFFEVDGVRYSHSIDPRKGRPVRHQLVSVTVVHRSTTLADAWATALIVLGPEQALKTALRESLAVYLISREPGGLRVDKTPAIETYLQ
ncbi:MAG: FAD:protein FMN transferase [Gammaproteobacteria bacterium]|nr:FAD:protein FMN transferase [Gammaproteobacteria bacterium]